MASFSEVTQAYSNLSGEYKSVLIKVKIYLDKLGIFVVYFGQYWAFCKLVEVYIIN
jgi:hypothetical protein